MGSTRRGSPKARERRTSAAVQRTRAPGEQSRRPVTQATRDRRRARGTRANPDPAAPAGADYRASGSSAGVTPSSETCTGGRRSPPREARSGWKGRRSFSRVRQRTRPPRERAPCSSGPSGTERGMPRTRLPPNARRAKRLSDMAGNSLMVPKPFAWGLLDIAQRGGSTWVADGEVETGRRAGPSRARVRRPTARAARRSPCERVGEHALRTRSEANGHRSR